MPPYTLPPWWTMARFKRNSYPFTQADEISYLVDSTFPLILTGFLLGSVYASVSCPVVMPSVAKHGKNASGSVNWPQLICTAGGIDTGLSVGVFGVIFTFMFYETDDNYRYIKVSKTPT